MKKIFTFLLTAFVSVSLFAQYNINFGPYLQSPTPNSIKIKWKTDQAVASKIMYGSSPVALTLVAEDIALTTNHTLLISGLQPLTQYFYAVYNDTVLVEGADSNYRFTTFPVANDNDTMTVRAWVIGDFGKGSSEQQRVRESFLNYESANEKKTDLWLWLGDNVYQDGLDQEYRDKVFDSVYGYKNIMTYLPFEPTPGNHDYNSISPVTNSEPPLQHIGAYYDIVDVYKNGEAGGVPTGHELFYSYDYRNVHFISLNSELGSLYNQSEDWIGVYLLGSFSTSPLKTWLLNDLQANTKPWVVVYFHQPPHTNGSHDADAFWEVYMKAMRENFAPILEQYGVDLVLCGHSHVYERSYLTKGMYGDVASFTPNMIMDNGSGDADTAQPYVKYLQGNNPNAGTVYAIVGNSGSKDSDPPFGHPLMYAEYGCDSCVGSLILDVKGNRMDGRYLGGDGQFHDHFTIIKKDEIPAGVKNVVNSYISNISISPNPFSNTTQLSFELKNACNVNVTLTDLAGREIIAYADNTTQGKHQIAIDAKQLNLAKGNYAVKLMCGGEVAAHAIMVVQ